jgi:hypothetical protein
VQVHSSLTFRDMLGQMMLKSFIAIRSEADDFDRAGGFVRE